MTIETPPLSIVTTDWYRLIPTTPKPDIWDLCVDNGQHLGWDRCWAFVLSYSLAGSELSIVWAIAYAMKSACEEVAEQQMQAAYEQGWRDSCDDHRQQRLDPKYPIGEGKQRPYEPTEAL